MLQQNSEILIAWKKQLFFNSVFLFHHNNIFFKQVLTCWKFAMMVDTIFYQILAQCAFVYSDDGLE